MPSVTNDIAADLRANTEGVLSRWEERADKLPWIHLPDADRRDRLPDVIRGLVDAGLIRPASADFVREAVRSAVDHGRDRRRQGLEVEDILSEYYALRTAIWAYLRDQPHPIADAADAMFRIDAAITTATGASLFGYHEAEMPTGNTIARHVERLVNESVLLAGMTAGEEI